MSHLRKPASRRYNNDEKKKQEKEDFELAQGLAKSLEIEQNEQKERLEEDEEFAKILQQQEEDGTISTPKRKIEPNSFLLDEELARVLQLEDNEHEERPKIKIPNVQIESTLDEEIARGLQEDEITEANEPQNIGNFGSPIPSFVTNPNMYSISSDEEDLPQLSFRPLNSLQGISPFINMLASDNHAILLSSLAERNRQMNGNQIPSMNPLFPFVSFQPPLMNMMETNLPTDYESLLALDELIQPNRGASEEQIETIPTRKFLEGSLPVDAAKCGICLQDYEVGEELSTLPRCLHHFHKTCIDKWLSINKICPVCREDIEGKS